MPCPCDREQDGFKPPQTPCPSHFGQIADQHCRARDCRDGVVEERALGAPRQVAESKEDEQKAQTQMPPRKQLQEGKRRQRNIKERRRAPAGGLVFNDDGLPKIACELIDRHQHNAPSIRVNQFKAKHARDEREPKADRPDQERLPRLRSAAVVVARKPWQEVLNPFRGGCQTQKDGAVNEAAVSIGPNGHDQRKDDPLPTEVPFEAQVQIEYNGKDEGGNEIGTLKKAHAGHEYGDGDEPEGPERSRAGKSPRRTEDYQHEQDGDSGLN